MYFYDLLLGFPSVGKSTLLSTLAGVYSEVAAYEFTTLTTVPGCIKYKGAKIQVANSFICQTFADEFCNFLSTQLLSQKLSFWKINEFFEHCFFFYQLLDLPGIIEGAKDGKGRGRQVIAVARTCSLIFIVLDV